MVSIKLFGNTCTVKIKIEDNNYFNVDCQGKKTVGIINWTHLLPQISEAANVMARSMFYH